MVPLKFSEIAGNWATLLLATDRSGNIDYKKLADEIDVLIASRPNGIYSNGTAGEFYAQTEDEFLKINTLLAEKCEESGVFFQIGVSHMSPQVSLERLKNIRHLKPGAVQVILPDWFPPTLEESIIYLEKMASEAGDIPLILYNPPHAKKKLEPEDWNWLKSKVPSLAGLKVADRNRDPDWYARMRKNSKELSVFIPGHHLATGIALGAQGAYSNMACLNPFAAQHWYNMILSRPDDALELETRIIVFMKELIEPLIVNYGYPNHACDRFLAMVGNWAGVGDRLRWPYRSVPESLVEPVRKRARKIIPEFFARDKFAD